LSDLFDGNIQPFDIIVLAVIVVSAVMSLGRGLIREAFSVISFIIGGIAAYFAVVFLGEPLRSVLPAGWPAVAGNSILVIVGFLVAYSLAAFLGGRLSRLIHSSPEIGVVDRLAGAIFGIIRGVVAAILFVLLMQQALPPESTPAFVAKAGSYPYLDVAASWIRDTVPGFVERATQTVPGPESAGADDA
jgi:membrane protein required for colicin V production